MSTDVQRLFFALWPDRGACRELAERAAGLRERLQLGGRPVPPDRYHLTLHFLGDRVGAEALAAAATAATRVHAAPFALVLDRAGTFAGRGRPCWIGPAQPPPALDRLHAALRSELDAAGVPVAGPAFTAHVTVLRGAARQIRHTPVEPVACRFAEFSLVRSVLGAAPQYEILRTYSLKE